MREIGWSQALLGVGAVGAAITGGVMFAFSTMVMPGLDRLARTDPRGAVATMQEINVLAVRPPLMTVLLGTTAVALGVAAVGVWRLPGAVGWLALSGAAVFVLGVTATTIVGNVPLNEALAAVAPGDDPARAWAAFAPGWTLANHVRTVAGVVSAALLAAATRIA